MHLNSKEKPFYLRISTVEPISNFPAKMGRWSCRESKPRDFFWFLFVRESKGRDLNKKNLPQARRRDFPLQCLFRKETLQSLRDVQIISSVAPSPPPNSRAPRTWFREERPEVGLANVTANEHRAFCNTKSTDCRRPPPPRLFVDLQSCLSRDRGQLAPSASGSSPFADRSNVNTQRLYRVTRYHFALRHS